MGFSFEISWSWAPRWWTIWHNGVLFVVLGTAELIGGLVAVLWMLHFHAIAHQLPGVVVEPRDGYPVVEWMTPQGEVRHFSARVTGAIIVYDRGEHVTVRYDPAAPEKSVQLDSFAENWGMAMFLGLSGLIFAAVGTRCVRDGRAERARLRGSV